MRVYDYLEPRPRHYGRCERCWPWLARALRRPRARQGRLSLGR
ncbi:MAG: hypothetical protein ACRD2Z_09775 [Thermoanaerobaculia bacterium]